MLVSLSLKVFFMSFSTLAAWFSSFCYLFFLFFLSSQKCFQVLGFSMFGEGSGRSVFAGLYLDQSEISAKHSRIIPDTDSKRHNLTAASDSAHSKNALKGLSWGQSRQKLWLSKELATYSPIYLSH